MDDFHGLVEKLVNYHNQEVKSMDKTIIAAIYKLAYALFRFAR